MVRPRTGLGANARGFVHEALIYSSDDEFAAAAVPFLRDGLDAGEAAVLGVKADLQRLVVDALGPDSGLTLFDPEAYANPFDAIQRKRELFGGLARSGAAQIRVVGAVPASEASWRGWGRYEAAINHLMDDLPLWGICPYDTRSTSDHVLADVERTHPHLTASGGEHRPNPAFVDPERFLAACAQAEVDPIEARPPDLELHDPAVDVSRHRVAALADSAAFSPTARQDIAVAVDEVVANAQQHGKAPVRLRAWRGDDRVVVAVSDGGTGLADPYAGMLPRDILTGRGLGLHIAYQVCDGVTFTYSAREFTVHLVMLADK